jgi:trehalose-phosphatase
VFEYYTERTPGSFIEEKQLGLVWHYRAADNFSYGAWQAAECQNHLRESLDNVLPIHILAGSKNIEVMPRAASPALATQRVLTTLSGIELVVAVGGSRAFEDIFDYLEQGSTARRRPSMRSDGQSSNDVIPFKTITCMVGKRSGYARFTVRRSVNAIDMLERLTGLIEEDTESDEPHTIHLIPPQH